MHRLLGNVFRSYMLDLRIVTVIKLSLFVGFTLVRVHHRNAGLEDAQAGIKIAGRNINNLRYADDRTKEPLDESESGE